MLKLIFILHSNMLQTLKLFKGVLTTQSFLGVLPHFDHKMAAELSFVYLPPAAEVKMQPPPSPPGGVHF